MDEPRENSKLITQVNDTVELDVRGLASLAISLRGTFAGTFTFKGSIDGKTYFNLDCTPIPTGTIVAGATAVGQWQANVAGLLSVLITCTVFTSGAPEVMVRAIPSGGSSGGGASSGGAATVADGADVNAGTTTDAAVSTDATATMSAKLRGLIVLLVALSKAEDAAHASGDKGIMGLGVRRATPTDLSAGATDGDYEPFQVDANGAVWQSLATLIFGENATTNRMMVSEDYTGFSITTQTTTTVKSGAGKLKRIVIPTPVASATVKIYDNTAGSGTVLLDTVTLPATLVSDGPITVELGLSFATGLTIVTAGATMAVDGAYL